jgi:hypothetical protein
MLMTGDPSSELQQYLHLDGHPSVGMSMMWKGFFITSFSLRQGIRVIIVPVQEKADQRGTLPAGFLACATTVP